MTNERTINFQIRKLICKLVVLLLVTVQNNINARLRDAPTFYPFKAYWLRDAPTV